MHISQTQKAARRDRSGFYQRESPSGASPRCGRLKRTFLHAKREVAQLTERKLLIAGERNSLYLTIKFRRKTRAVDIRFWRFLVSSTSRDMLSSKSSTSFDKGARERRKGFSSGESSRKSAPPNEKISSRRRDVPTSSSAGDRNDSSPL